MREELLRSEREAKPPSPDRLLSIDEAAAMIGIGRTALYAEIGKGRLKTIKVGPPAAGASRSDH